MILMLTIVRRRLRTVIPSPGLHSGPFIQLSITSSPEPDYDTHPHTQILEYHVVPGEALSNLATVTAPLATLLPGHTLQARCTHWTPHSAWPGPENGLCQPR